MSWERDYLTPARANTWHSPRASTPTSSTRRAGTPVSLYRAPRQSYTDATPPADHRPAAGQPHFHAYRETFGASFDYRPATAAAAAPRYRGPTSATAPRAGDGYGDFRTLKDSAAPGTPGADYLDRGRESSPRTPTTTAPGYGFSHAAAWESRLAPPRPHMRAAHAAGGEHPSTPGWGTSRWAPAGPAASSPRRHASPSGYATVSSPASGKSPRSPSMIKDPCTTFLPAAHPNASHRLCLALDLDETLVHARDGPVRVRPFAKDLLRALHDMDVEVIVWTAGERDYAQSVIRMLDPLGTIQHCVYRHPKWWTGQPGYTKNLRALGRNLSRCLLVDNTPDCLRDQPENGLLVSDFDGKGYDECLRALLFVIEEIVDRPYDAVPRILADSRNVVRRSVPMDAGGHVSVWTLACDRLVSQGSYQTTRVNRDSPVRARSQGRW